jgi:hypothetical protein
MPGQLSPRSDRRPPGLLGTSALASDEPGISEGIVSEGGPNKVLGESGFSEKHVPKLPTALTVLAAAAPGPSGGLTSADAATTGARSTSTRPTPHPTATLGNGHPDRSDHGHRNRLPKLHR